MEAESIQRADYRQASLAYQALQAVDRHVASGPLEARLVEMVKVRVSQMNGCAFCLDYHHTAALAAGLEPRQLAVLAAWREAPLFSARERAALAWAEALTRVAEKGVPDELYALASRHFSPEELVDLAYAVAAINAFNRLGVAFHRPLPA
jgi:AhpD family alkylhydroperoxidase